MAEAATLRAFHNHQSWQSWQSWQFVVPLGSFADLFWVFNLGSSQNCWIVIHLRPSYNPFSLVISLWIEVGGKVLSFGEVAKVSGNWYLSVTR